MITIEEQGKDKLTIAESGAIAEYLVERFGKGKLGVPAGGDPEMRTKYLFWVHAAEGVSFGVSAPRPSSGLLTVSDADFHARTDAHNV